MYKGNDIDMKNYKSLRNSGPNVLEHDKNQSISVLT